MNTQIKCIKLCLSLLLFSLSLILVSNARADLKAQGQPFQELKKQIDTQQELIEQLRKNQGPDPIEVTVICGSGSINDALSQYTGATAPLILTINGNCDETVTIQRNNVTLRGATNSDGLALSAAATPAIGALPGLSGITIENMTLDLAGGGFAILSSNSSFTVNNVTFNNANIGVLVVNLGRVMINNSIIDGPGIGTGVLAGNLGSVQLGSTTVRNSAIGVYANSNADVFLGDFTGNVTLIEDNNIGVWIYNSSNISLGNVEISNNGTGIEVFPNDTMAINANLITGGGGYIKNNTGIGIILHQNTSVTNFSGDFDVENNGGFGIVCESNVAFTGVLPSLNGNNGGGTQHDNCPLP